MKLYKLIEQQSDELILFFGGWATDFNPFGRLTSDNSDVVMLYDYTTLELEGDNEELERLLNKYGKISVIAWSMGVWAASAVWQKHKLSTSKITSATAINGTLKAVDEQFGINPIVFDKTIDNLPQGLPRFNLRMCGNKSTLEDYNNSPSQRHEDELKEELISIREQSQFINSIEWNRAIIGTKDLIFTAKNQQQFWQEYKATSSNKLEIKEVDEPHFLFNSLKSWDEI